MAPTWRLCRHWPKLGPRLGPCPGPSATGVGPGGTPSAPDDGSSRDRAARDPAPPCPGPAGRWRRHGQCVQAAVAVALLGVRPRVNKAEIPGLASVCRRRPRKMDGKGHSQRNVPLRTRSDSDSRKPREQVLCLWPGAHPPAPAEGLRGSNPWARPTFQSLGKPAGHQQRALPPSQPGPAASRHLGGPRGSSRVPPPERARPTPGLLASHTQTRRRDGVAQATAEVLALGLRVGLGSRCSPGLPHVLLAPRVLRLGHRATLRSPSQLRKRPRAEGSSDVPESQSRCVPSGGAECQRCLARPPTTRTRGPGRARAADPCEVTLPGPPDWAQCLALTSGRRETCPCLVT